MVVPASTFGLAIRGAKGGRGSGFVAETVQTESANESKSSTLRGSRNAKNSS